MAGSEGAANDLVRLRIRPSLPLLHEKTLNLARKKIKIDAKKLRRRSVQQPAIVWINSSDFVPASTKIQTIWIV